MPLGIFPLFIGLSIQWAPEGHFIIARIAQKMIDHKNMEWITKLFSLWPSESGNMLDNSIWLDQLLVNESYLTTMRTWHFVNTPIIDSSSSYSGSASTYNITNAISDSYSTLMNSSTTSLWALSFSIRNLIHLVGDIHCPLHSAMLYSAEFPTGDAGGNFYNLNCSCGSCCTNLHSLFDNAVLDFQFPIGDLLSNSEFLSNFSKLISNFPKSSFSQECNDVNPKDWAAESFLAAKQYAYGPLNGSSVVPSSFFAAGANHTKTRIALAGYRLGTMLSGFFSQRGRLILDGSDISAREIAVWSIDCAIFVSILAYAWLLSSACPKLAEAPVSEGRSLSASLLS